MITSEQLDDLKYQQSVDPESIELMQGNIDPEYEFPVHEKNFVHVRQVERGNFNMDTGEKMATPRIQKYSPREYHRMVEHSHSILGNMEITMLHKPQELDELEKSTAAKKAK